MGKKQHSAEQIVVKMREIELFCKQHGASMAEACRQAGITDSTYYTWRKKYGSMGTDDVRRLQALEKENARLKQLVAEIALDKKILQETVSNFS